MKRTLSAAVLIGLLTLSTAGQTKPKRPGSLEGRARYGNRPDSLYPYAQVQIHRDVYDTTQDFKGSGREAAEPHVDRVRIGFIGPLLAEDSPSLAPHLPPAVVPSAKTSFGRNMLRGATMALEEANLSGGYQGLQFELIRRTDLVLWGQTSNELASFAYEDRVWAILSSLDSNHNHVLNRAALKARVPVVNAGSTDPTLTEHNIPWLVRCISNDRQSTYELLNQIYRIEAMTQVAVLRVNDRDGRVGIAEFVKGARRLGHPIRAELRFEPGDTDFAGQLDTIRKLGVEGIVLWANPAEAASIIRQIRERGMSEKIFGFDRMAHPLFLKAAGAAADGVIVAATFNPHRNDPDWVTFQNAYRERTGEEPDAWAAHGYDGMRLIILAIRAAGLNRTRIRDWLYQQKQVAGVTGTIEFDPTLTDISRPWLARVTKGRFEYFRPPDWERSGIPPNPAHRTRSATRSP